MKREIKFKAKRDDNNEWVEGSYVYGERSNTHVITYETLKGGEFGAIDNMPELDYVSVNIRPETLCQFIGLQDKNGVDVYEGDEFFSNNRHVIVFRNGCYFIKTDGVPSLERAAYESVCWREVAGNTHD